MIERMGGGAQRERQEEPRHHPLRLRRNEKHTAKKHAVSGEHPGFVRYLSGVAFRGLLRRDDPSDDLARGSVRNASMVGSRPSACGGQALDLLQATQHAAARLLAGEFLGLRM